MNTKRGALREGCSAFSAARAAATSGRSCSAACRVFFERDLLTIVEAPDRARSNLELLRAAEPQADVIERQVRLLGDKIEQPLLMLVQRRAAMAGAGLGLDAAGRRPALDPANCRRGTDVSRRGGLDSPKHEPDRRLRDIEDIDCADVLSIYLSDVGEPGANLK